MTNSDINFNLKSCSNYGKMMETKVKPIGFGILVDDMGNEYLCDADGWGHVKSCTTKELYRISERDTNENPIAIEPLNTTAGYQKVYQLVEEARCKEPVDINTLNDIRDTYGYDLYNAALQAVVKKHDLK